MFPATAGRSPKPRRRQPLAIAAARGAVPSAVAAGPRGRGVGGTDVQTVAASRPTPGRVAPAHAALPGHGLQASGARAVLNFWKDLYLAYLTQILHTVL